MDIPTMHRISEVAIDYFNALIVNYVADLTLFDILGDNSYFILHRKTDTILQ